MEKKPLFLDLLKWVRLVRESPPVKGWGASFQTCSEMTISMKLYEYESSPPDLYIYILIYVYLLYTIWLFNIAMGHHHF
jgi:hypothetical protein